MKLVAEIRKYLGWERAADHHWVQAVGAILDLKDVRLNGVRVTATAEQLNAAGADVTEVANKTDAPLTKGTVVLPIGYDSTLAAPSVEKASADDPASPALLVLTETIAVGAKGTAMSKGTVTGLDTSGLTVGDIVFLSSTAGEWTAAAPSGSTKVVQALGFVTAVGKTGAILFIPGDRVFLRWPVTGIPLSEGSVIVGNAIDQGSEVDASGDGNLLIGDGTTVGSKAVTGAVAITNAGLTSLNLTQGSVFRGDAEDAAEELDASDAGKVLVGDGTTVQSVAVSVDGSLAANGAFTATHAAHLTEMVPGLFAVGGDADGGCLAGCDQALDITKTTASAAFAKSYDHGTTTYKNLSATAGGPWTANFQAWPDTEAEDDAVYFGASKPFAQVVTALAQGGEAVYAADSVAWEYWNGAWTALTLAYDKTDDDDQDGDRPFQVSGATAFVVPEDFAACEVGNEGATQLGFWIRARVKSGANITTIPVFADEHALAEPARGIQIRRNCNITGVRMANGNGTVHSANDVKFQIVNFTKGTFSNQLTWAQTKRAESWWGTALKTGTGLIECNLNDEIGFVVHQEDGTNELTNVVAALSLQLRAAA